MDGQPIALGARAFDLLITLVEQRHRVVSKGELMDQVWPGLVVEENNLQVQISALRRVLGAQAIATVPGRGYRFVMPEADPSSDALPADAGPSAALPLAAAPAPGPAATPHNLLPERSRFIGRAQELAECRHLLRDAQMLSLVAIGGCGKTRMALKLAEQGLADHPDGVWFVDLAPLQDSNDYYLGNLQKDGSYSVVPRMAGGEVTPDGLIAVGQVAKKYGLYTKITGGQRVDLFGAKVDQLPAIWEELIAAGFESGHAYGKSLRTVKSCVGSTWCRYGVDDSLGLAVMLENRYKGLRAPHKIKFGVSGCTRECAEAQGKDVGIIATDKGWNLYVCGNGGMKPRHAELLAADLDQPTLVKLIDRFLMFYVRTADRLQRTSTWRDNLEGGLDYLKDVLVKDSLGLGAELQAQMQHVVETYQCEWKTAVTDPQVRQRFRSFVNIARAPVEAPPPEGPRWVPVCRTDDILPEAGVAALVDEQPIAIFRLGDGSFHAIDDVDPKSGASVLSRGLVGNLGERLVVASPMYKNHFDLRSGECIEAPEHSVRAHAVRVQGDQVLVALAHTMQEEPATA
ncbi:MAG: nitrite reductase small subunit NirD [Aquincola sp.]|nr:nitrite reductase small subunit NirD [Aquincola sp.]